MKKIINFSCSNLKTLQLIVIQSHYKVCLKTTFSVRLLIDRFLTEKQDIFRLELIKKQDMLIIIVFVIKVEILANFDFNFKEIFLKSETGQPRTAYS